MASPFYGEKEDEMFKGLNVMAETVHANAIGKGWWDNPTDSQGYAVAGKANRNFGEICALIHSEISEAFEEYRKGLDPKVTYLAGPDAKPEGIPTELADTIIRILDYCAHEGIDIEAAMTRKHLYNTTRPYRHGGKKA